MLTLKEERDVAEAEARRAALLAGIAEAEAALRALNLRTFRDAMRALFERHPALESVRFDQEAAYNDVCYGLGIDALWVNDLHFFVGESILYDDADLTPYFGPPRDPLRPPTGIPDPDGDPRDPRPFHGTPTAADLDLPTDDELRAEYGPVYDAGQDAIAALSDLRTRYGLHFFWDAFGPVAAVEVTREAVRVTDALTVTNWCGPRETRREDLGASWPTDTFGAYTPAYLALPERGALVATRDVHRAERLRLDHYLAAMHLARVARASPEARPFSYTIDHHYGDASVVAVSVAGHTIPVWDSHRGSSEYALRPEGRYAGLRVTLSTAVSGPLARWLEALAEVRRRYGRDALPTPESGEQTHTF